MADKGKDLTSYFAVKRKSGDNGKDGNGNDGDGSPSKKRPALWNTSPAKSPPPTPSSSSSTVPLTFVSWNVNSLLPRLLTKDNGADWAGFKALLQREGRRPDVVALQEVMLPASKNGSNPRRRTVMDQSTPELRRQYASLHASITGMGYSFLLALADKKRAGTLVMVRRELQPAVRGTAFNLPGAGGPEYEEQGRVILLEFGEFDVLATYAPNHGYDETSFARRRRWDEQVLAFFQARRKPLVWLGDLNVSRLQFDVSNQDFFARQQKNNPPADHKGQPGYTPIERRRFAEVMARGGLVDAYRALHPEQGENDWTWRGANVPSGMYYGKGMRIDYTLVSQSLLAPPHSLRIKRAEVLGRGKECVGFFGSDHCPILLELEREEQPSLAAAAAPIPSPASVGTAAVVAEGGEGDGAGTVASVAGVGEEDGGGKQGDDGVVDLTGDD